MPMTEEEKKARREARKKAREEAARLEIIRLEREQKPVDTMTLTIEWSKSRMWGANPHCTAQVRFKDGSYTTSEDFTCSGCGYDKESTVIAAAFNAFLKYKLWAMNDEQIKGGHGSNDHGPAPYGICHYGDSRHYSGGIGTSCYYSIAEYIGGTFEKIASGKMFDAFKYTDTRKEGKAS